MRLIPLGGLIVEKIFKLLVLSRTRHRSNSEIHAGVLFYNYFRIIILSRARQDKQLNLGINHVAATRTVFFPVIIPGQIYFVTEHVDSEATYKHVLCPYK